MEHKLIATNTLFQLAAKIITVAFGFFTSIVIASSLGVSGYGDFTKITVFIGLFYLFIDFGLNAVFLQKETTEKGFQSLIYLRLLIACSLIGMINAIIIIFIKLSILPGIFPAHLQFGFFLYSFTFLSQAIILTSQGLFQKNLVYSKSFFILGLGSLLTFMLVLFFHSQENLFFVLMSYLLGSVLSAILALILINKQITKITIDILFIKELLKESTPVALMLIFNLISFRVDVLILSLFQSTGQVGAYGFAYRIFDFLIAIPLFLSNSIYPLLIQRLKNSRINKLIVKQYLYIFLCTSLVITFCSWLLAPLISLVKIEFAQSIILFRILCISLPLFFMTSFFQWMLIAEKQQKFLCLVYFICAILNIFLNILFIPREGAIAAAVITDISEALVLILLVLKFFSARRTK